MRATVSAWEARSMAATILIAAGLFGLLCGLSGLVRLL